MSNYVNNKEFFKEICLWQDFKQRIDVIEILDECISNDIDTIKETAISYEINKPTLNKQKIVDCYILEKQKAIEIYILKKKELILSPREKQIYRKTYDALGEKLMAMINKLANMPQYSGYAFKEDMKMLAFEHCIKGLTTFDRERTNNPFAFFTRGIWRAFWQEIAKEKNIFNEKFNHIKDFVEEKLLRFDYNKMDQNKINEEMDEIERALVEELQEKYGDKNDADNEDKNDNSRMCEVPDYDDKIDEEESLKTKSK
jgi:hypothetical protein